MNGWEFVITLSFFAAGFVVFVATRHHVDPDDAPDDIGYEPDDEEVGW